MLETPFRACRDRTTGTLDTGSTVATLRYDGLGRRISKKIENSGDWEIPGQDMVLVLTSCMAGVAWRGGKGDRLVF